MTHGPKRITQGQILGETAVQFIGRRFLEMGLLWHPTNAPLDAGIDGFVEVRDAQTGEATNTWLAVQSKGRTKLEKETETSFEFSCTPRDLDYWRRGNMPVILVVSRPDQDEAWWVSVKDYFKVAATAQAPRRIVFDKQADALSLDAAPKLLQLAQQAGAGTYFRPSPRRELLDTNLLRIRRFPQHIYWASTSFRDANQLRNKLRQSNRYPPLEWVLKDKLLYSVYDLRDEPWASVCDAGSTEQMTGAEWAASNDREERRLLVWLLNECLRSLTGRIGMRYDRALDANYFRSTSDLRRGSSDIKVASNLRSATSFGLMSRKPIHPKLPITGMSVSSLVSDASTQPGVLKSIRHTCSPLTVKTCTLTTRSICQRSRALKGVGQ